MGGIVWSCVVSLKWPYLPLLLSDYTREILRRKYDAIATDRAYENQPSGLLGPVGRWLDRKVLEFPTHEGLRQRLRIVVETLEAQILRQAQGEATPVRVLSAPCGLARDLLLCAEQLKRRDVALLGRVEFHGLDLDASGEVLPLAAKRAEEADVQVRLHRQDLFDPLGIGQVLGQPSGFQVVNCIGLTPWLDLPEVEHLCRTFRTQVLAPRGAFIVDNFAPHKYGSLAKDMEIHSRYHAPQAFEETLRNAGFEIVEKKSTANSVNTVYLARVANMQ
jgi:hypothetical protein